MGMNKDWKNENNRTRGRQEVYNTGKELGYHLGYNVGFESGFEKGYVEGSTFGYNNGFLAALRIGEGAGAEGETSAGLPHDKVCHAVRKLLESGQVKVFLSGSAAREAQILFKLLSIEADVATEDINGNR